MPQSTGRAGRHSLLFMIIEGSTIACIDIHHYCSSASASALGLDPNDPDGDTDDDAASDVIETGADPSNPMPVDSDGDGVIDALEPRTSAIDASVASGLTLSSGDTMSITTVSGEMLSEVSAAAATGGPTVLPSRSGQSAIARPHRSVAV